MCEPTTLMMMATVATIGSTVLSAAGQVQQGNAQAQAGQYNAQVADMNATMAETRAKDALARGAVEEQQKRAQTAQLMGRQRAAMAANGVDLTFGSPLDTIVDTAIMGELDAMTIRQNAGREADDYRMQAWNARADAGLSRSNAKSAKTGGYLAAGGTVLGGAADVGKFRASPSTA